MRGDPIIHEFHRKIELIARGVRCVPTCLISQTARYSLPSRSYSRRKALKGTVVPGSSKVIYEAKLTKGDRILYTERLYNQNCRSVIIWAVSSHDKISMYAEKIRDSYWKFERRLLDQKQHMSSTVCAMDELLDETIMMDPSNNTLLRTFECSVFDLQRFVSSNWEPPVKLTTHERDIVERQGSVLLQGRGGTGKTLCIISRLFRDYLAASHQIASKPQSPAHPRILFVSYSHRNQHQVMEKIRDHVRVNCDGSQEEATQIAKDMVLSVVENNNMDKFMRDKHKQLRHLLCGDDWLKHFRFRADVTSSESNPRHVSFHRFQKEIWGGDQGILARLRSNHDANLVNQLSAIVAFSNIRTFIKGGVKHLQDQIEPEQGLPPLSQEEYMQVHENDCSIPVYLREIIYKAYRHYDDHLKRHKLWDDADLDADVYAMVAHICRRSRLEKSDFHTKILLNEYQPHCEAGASAKSVRALTYDRIFVDECQDMSPGKSVAVN